MTDKGKVAVVDLNLGVQLSFLDLHACHIYLNNRHITAVFFATLGESFKVFGLFFYIQARKIPPSNLFFLVYCRECLQIALVEKKTKTFLNTEGEIPDVIKSHKCRTIKVCVAMFNLARNDPLNKGLGPAKLEDFPSK